MFQAHRDNAKMRGTNGDKEVKCSEMDLLILDVLGKDNHSVEGLDGDDCFQAEETSVDPLQAKLPTSVLPADILSPSFVRDQNRNMYTGHRHTVHVTH